MDLFKYILLAQVIGGAELCGGTILLVVIIDISTVAYEFFMNLMTKMYDLIERC